ncbi:MAG: SMC-Scp complex subunit ScpB [Eubacterium sp.]|nr:SMC-Scp complex subunit ScpB [Eubacterium sp.]
MAEDKNTKIAALEAVLFTMGEPLELSRLAEAIEEPAEGTEELLSIMRERYEGEDHGIQLLFLDGKYQLTTKKDFFDTLVRVASHPKKPVLTDVMMETLSIIAYKQPVTRTEIEQIRGVSCEHAVNRLMDYDLVRELGRLQVPGRPILLGTTDTFLRHFGLQSTEELPVLSAVDVEDFKAEAEAELQMKVDV